MVLPRFVQQALIGQELTIFGDGTQSRCFCHVADTVEGLIRVLDTEETVGDVFNIGSQNEISIRGLAEMVVELAGSPSGVTFVPYEQAYEPGFEDMERRLPDLDKVAAVTGWRPTRTLHDIVRDVIDYERQRLRPGSQS